MSSQQKLFRTGVGFVFKQFVSGSPLRIIAYGDTQFTDPAVTSGTNPRVRKWLVDKIADEHPQVLLLTGDTPFTGSQDADWQVFQNETAPWRDRHILELPTTGNHEIKGDRVAGIRNYLANFPAIEKHRYYSALLGSVEVISLDCISSTTPSSPQGRWFAAQLNQVPAQVEFLLILYHVPWVADRQSQILVGLPKSQALGLRNILEARLDRIHAKVVVFNGHIHNYERFVRRGVEYAVSGGGGSRALSPPAFAATPTSTGINGGFPIYHYLTVEIATITSCTP